MAAWEPPRSGACASRAGTAGTLVAACCWSMGTATGRSQRSRLGSESRTTASARTFSAAPAALLSWHGACVHSRGFRCCTHGGSQGLHGQRLRGPGGAATQGAAVTQRDTHAAGEATHARGEGAAQGGKVRACAVSPSAGGSGAVPTTAARVRVPTQGSQARRPHSTERARAQVGQPRTKPQPVGGDHRAGGCVGRAWYAQLQGLRMLGVPAAMLTGVCACGCLVVVTAPRPGCVHRAPAKGHAQWAAVLREGVV